MLIAAGALARGGWREQYNQAWRFSKTGLWIPLIQVLAGLLLLWRLGPAPTRVVVTLPVATVASVELLLSFVAGLIWGRESLYGRSVLRALHVSPASGASILLGLTLAGLPGRLLSSLVLSLVVGLLLPAGGFWWTIPLLWITAMLSGLVGYAAALLALVVWVRLHPKSLALMWGIALLLGVSLVLLLVFVLMVGRPLSAIIPVLKPALPWLLGAMGVVVGLPGLGMGLWLALYPGRAGEWYREAYLRMQELGEGRPRTRRSRWPQVLPGPAGALQALYWRELGLNWFTWIRLALMFLPLAILIRPSQELTELASRFPEHLGLAFGLLGALGAFAEVAATIGSSDGPNIGLSMVAGVRAIHVVAAKWVANLPLALLAGLCTWVSALLLGYPSLRLSLTAGLIGLGGSAVALAGGLFDLDPLAEVPERDVPEVLRAALEQAPRKRGDILGFAGSILFAVLASWLCLRWSDLMLPLSLGLAALAHVPLVGGYMHLKRLGMHSQTRPL